MRVTLSAGHGQLGEALRGNRARYPLQLNGVTRPVAVEPGGRVIASLRARQRPAPDADLPLIPGMPLLVHVRGWVAIERG